MKNRPYILSIAGFDPSGGAGLVADIKTIEALKGYGLSVCTANTIQNDKEFQNCLWVDLQTIKNQIEILINRFRIDIVKIGIVQNWSVLNEIIDFLLYKDDKIKIILDPVLSASAGFDFTKLSLQAESRSNELFDDVLSKIYLLTPNYQEIQKLYPNKTIEDTVKHISGKTNLFLKGGHRKEAIGKDQLFTIQGQQFNLNPKGNHISEKHGSGCVLSSAIAAYLGLGFPLLKACFKAKRYTEKVLSSNKTLLAYHKI